MDLIGRTWLITGGGGSIGAASAREIMKLSPKRIIAADIYENGAYELQCELGDKVSVEIVSVRDKAGVDALFCKYRPDVVLHAAAHKHVPLMEKCPAEAVKNNITGTRVTADAAERWGAKCFVLISTDKAVEPISIMGASKRVCEMLVYEKSLTPRGSVFTAVRFGNVLNSSGSVIPLFKRQLKTGTLKVTHPEVTRYFMTAPEAAELVMRAVQMSKGGEIFVPDMGGEVRILDVARSVIHDAGLSEDAGVRIEFTGLRDGDKLREKLFFNFERREKTAHKKIWRVRGSSIDGLDAKINELERMAEENNSDGIRKLIISMTN